MTKTIRGLRVKEIFEAIELEAQFDPHSVDLRKVAEAGNFTIAEVYSVATTIGYKFIDSCHIDSKVINV